MTDTECEVYLRGFVDGLKTFAWWRDGTEYVGETSCAPLAGWGITLAKAVDCATDKGFCNMPREVREYLQAKKS